jgi:hypothetical protein
MGNNIYFRSGNRKKGELDSIYKFNYFENKNLKIKKILCNCDIIFLTGFLKNN